MSNEIQQWNQFHDVLQRKQNFCTIEERKAPLLFALLLNSEWSALGQDIHVYYHHDCDGNAEVVVGQEQWYDAYVSLLAARGTYHRHMFQIAMGTLLGYDFEDCIDYATSPVDCDCEKCGGPDTNASFIARKFWIEGGCQHPLQRDSEAFLFGPVRFEGTRPYQTITVCFPNGNETPYGKLMHPDPELLKHSPGIQEWSIPE
jgi:hypothetical protein